jgi:hypothetical protein
VGRNLEHPSRVARWSHGEFEGLPGASAASLTVWFAADPGDEDGVEAEGLLAEPIGPHRAVIAAIPVYIYNVNLGDEVEFVASAEGPLVATRVTRDAGRLTYRVWFADLFPGVEGAAPDERWKSLQIDLERFGCWFDMYSPQLIAVSAEPDVAAAVADYLAEGEAAGRFVYETGRTASPDEVNPPS